MDSKKEKYIPFKERVSLQDRKKEAEDKRNNQPKFIPIILEKHKKSNLQSLPKYKYLVSEDFQLYAFIQSVRKKFTINETESIFFFIDGNKLDKSELTLKTLYEKYKDKDDGFLYIEYSNQSTFGGI